MEEALDLREHDLRAELAALRHNDAEIWSRLDALSEQARLTESALHQEALRHERRRRDLKVVAVSLFAGLGVALALFYLERFSVFQRADLGAGSLVWTIAVVGLAISALGQLAIGISRYRRSLAAKFDLPVVDRSLHAE